MSRLAFTVIVCCTLTAQPSKKVPSSKPDTWQKSKECAAQAGKMMADWSTRTGSVPDGWNNHYSPKYDKCFVSVFLIQLQKDEKVFPSLSSTILFNAFERSPAIAASCTVVGKELDCVAAIITTMRDAMMDSVSRRINNKPFSEASADEQDNARTIAEGILKDVPPHTSGYCGIDGKAEDCNKAAAFIAEHMKN